MGLWGMGWGGINWVYLVHDRDRRGAVVKAVVNLLVPQDVGNFLTSWDSVSFSGRILLHRIQLRLIPSSWWLSCRMPSQMFTCVGISAVPCTLFFPPFIWRDVRVLKIKVFLHARNSYVVEDVFMRMPEIEVTASLCCTRGHLWLQRVVHRWLT